MAKLRSSKKRVSKKNRSKRTFKRIGGGACLKNVNVNGLKKCKTQLEVSDYLNSKQKCDLEFAGNLLALSRSNEYETLTPYLKTWVTTWTSANGISLTDEVSFDDTYKNRLDEVPGLGYGAIAAGHDKMKRKAEIERNRDRIAKLGNLGKP
jgi:hypothetical protein